MRLAHCVCRLEAEPRDEIAGRVGCPPTTDGDKTVACDRGEFDIIEFIAGNSGVSALGANKHVDFLSLESERKVLSGSAFPFIEAVLEHLSTRLDAFRRHQPSSNDVTVVAQIRTDQAVARTHDRTADDAPCAECHRRSGSKFALGVVVHFHSPEKGRRPSPDGLRRDLLHDKGGSAAYAAARWFRRVRRSRTSWPKIFEIRI